MIGWLAVAVARAGPWVHDPGTWYAKVAYGEVRAGEYVAPGGRSSASPMSYVGRSASAYAEVGVLPGVQLVAEVPWVSASNRFPGSALAYTTDGPGSLRAGVGLSPPGDLPVSLHAIGRFPLYGHPSGLSFAPALGEEQVDVDVVLAGGASAPIGPSRAWGLAEVGWRDRTRITFAVGPRVADFDDAALYHLQLGLKPALGGRERGWLHADVDGVVGLADPRRSHTLRGGAAVSLREGVHLEVGAAGVVDARQDALGWSWSLGVSHVRAAAQGQ